MDSSVRRSPNTPNDDRSALRDLLKSRQRDRKGVRGNPKSCIPCRERKVKCDKELPCSTCDKRGHPDLCNYESSTRQSLGIPQSPARSARRTSVVIPTSNRSQELEKTDAISFDIVEERVGDLVPGPEAQNRPTPQISTTSNNASTAREDGDRLFLADSSVIGMIRRRSIRSRDDPARQSAFETGILPLLGVNEEVNTSVSSYQSLPSDQEIVRLFELFRRRVHPFHVITFNLDTIEQRICQLINARRGSNLGSESFEDPRWLSLLHAIMAAGAQFSDMNLQDRLAVSQRHTKQSFDLLRSTDYLANPSKEAVQTLLLLGNVLQNDMKPQAAWVLGGTTIRLAQCLGLHKKTARPPKSPLTDEDAKCLRLAIVWQDALLALAFGRPPASYELDFESDLPQLSESSESSGLSYLQAMSWLCHVTLRHLSSHLQSSLGPVSVLDGIKSIEASLSPHLLDPTRSTAIPQIQEYYAFELHRHFVMATLCRPFVSRSGSTGLSESDRSNVLEHFRESLKRSVRAYVRLRSIAGHARRSWAFTHNGLTSVLLLSLMRETRYLAETRTLQDELIASLSEEGNSALFTDPDTNAQLSGTLHKALKALRTLRALTERDVSSRGSNQEQSDQDIPTPGHMPTVGERPAIGQDNAFRVTEQADFWDMGDAQWEFPIDFDMSPLGAFDYIMSDQNYDNNSFLPNLV
ncbi:fungal specific transcription factor [Colletotrichum abscissum]|uniref:Fungal specific transcription factor n=1 Tax=Colletotrichum abscissum TaxID=1671311 RepID=A0A9P9XEF6_9PEZI|nr:fungal specific transcription factor [Colletotrichum abscissum]KAI3550016.1 fungal specific transcription factor [Colletotrichum abscissum]KAK1498686.1 fungal specific transcription factor [Colletotrichum abscissum]